MMGILDWFTKKQEKSEEELAKIQSKREELERRKVELQNKLAERKAANNKQTSKKVSKGTSGNSLTVNVTGTNYRNQKEILSLGKINAEYSLDKRALIKKYPDGVTVYEYNFPTYAATFEFEPTNEHDPNAIKVLIKGIHVGYVKKGSCSRVRNLISQNNIKSISAKIYGGKSKCLYISGIYDDDEETKYFEFEKDNRDFKIVLTLTLTK